MIIVVRRERSVGFTATPGAWEGSHIPTSASIAASHAMAERHKIFACEEEVFLRGGCLWKTPDEMGKSVQGPQWSLSNTNVLPVLLSCLGAEAASKRSSQFAPAAAFSPKWPSAPKHRITPAPPAI